MLMSSLSYDGDLPKPQPGGVSHVSFMVDDLDELLAHLATKGVKPFKGPYEGSLGELGKRMVAMFRSPCGTMLSVITEAKAAPR
jgi:catechol 2,3-dioxygenase-like lactoylglutathione lyase family enzyme